MKYVVDASVAFKWIVPEAHAAKAMQLREDFGNGVHELLAPDVLPIEVGHGLTRAERQGRIAVAQATLLLADILAKPPAFHASLPLLVRACEISSQLRIGIYDCLYLALTEREQCELITADDRLLIIVRQHFPAVHLVSTP
jgi:predicted nucleic acid-binding protein